jgi:hypothetical protein
VKRSAHLVGPAALVAALVVAAHGREATPGADVVTADARPLAHLLNLPDDVARDVARRERTILEALRHLDDADLVRRAITDAQHVVQARLAHQGPAWWQTIDAWQNLVALIDFRP